MLKISSYHLLSKKASEETSLGTVSVSTGILNSLKTSLVHVQISSYIDKGYKIQRPTTYWKTKSGNQFLSLERIPKNWSLFGRFDQLFAIKSQTRVQNTFFELIAELRTSRRFDRCIERTGRTYRGENIPSRARFFRGHATWTPLSIKIDLIRIVGTFSKSMAKTTLYKMNLDFHDWSRLYFVPF